MKKLIFSTFLMLIVVGAAVIISQIAVGNIMNLFLSADTLSQPIWMATYSALSYIIAMLLILFLPQKITLKTSSKTKIITPNSNRKELGLKDLPTWADIGLAPVGFIIYLILAAIFTALFSLFPWFDMEEIQEIGFSVYSTGLDRVFAFTTLVVIAPIIEEIIFRGWLYGKMRKKFNEKVSDKVSMLISIFLVSLLFGLVHLQWNVGVNVFAMSIVLCALREITGTIYSGIILHILKNGIAFYLLFVLGL